MEMVVPVINNSSFGFEFRNIWTSRVCIAGSLVVTFAKF